jgi:hypothetical protein
MDKFYKFILSRTRYDTGLLLILVSIGLLAAASCAIKRYLSRYEREPETGDFSSEDEELVHYEQLLQPSDERV